MDFEKQRNVKSADEILSVINDDKESVIDDNDDRDVDLSNKYKQYSRPGLAKLLHAIRLDVNYRSAKGNYLHHRVNGEPVAVLDLLGGYGAGLFGHNYPPFKALLKHYLDSDRPFLVQASCRTNAALLGEKLDSMLHKSTGKNYVSIILNTGADAVEATIKHSDMLRQARFSSALKELQRRMVLVRQQFAAGGLQIEESLYPLLSKFYGIDARQKDLALAQFWERAVRASFDVDGKIISLERSFHGKSVGALQITYGELYRKPFTSLGPSAEFIPASDMEALSSAIQRNKIAYLLPVVENGVLCCEIAYLSAVSAMFIEPVQGEGGIHQIDADYLKDCRQQADAAGFQLVFDEIQSGMGRTGTFLSSQQQSVTADVYLLSKSLGGGLCKVSAACFDSNSYLPRFDRVHSSTFAEDDHSAGVALAALEELDRNPQLMLGANIIGDYLKDGLLALKGDYPTIIHSVRGVGLMLGITLQPQYDNDSLLFRALSEKDLLGHVAAAYLLHEHQIRIGAAMSDNFVLRLGPSFFLTLSECDYFLGAMQFMCEIIKRANAYEFVKYMVGLEDRPNDRPLERKTGCIDDIEDYRGRTNGRLEVLDPSVESVSFVATTVCSLRIAEVETSLWNLSKADMQALSDKIVDSVGDIHIQNTTVGSITGAKINVSISILFYDPANVVKHLRAGDIEHMKDDIEKVMDESTLQGHKVLGLGSYTSIITKNGQSLLTDSISLTTGNALTVGMGVRAILKSSHEKGFDMADACLAVLGAGGNIGSVYSEVLADYLPKLVLLGRGNRLSELHKVAHRIYREAAVSIVDCRYAKASVAAALAKTQTWQTVVEQGLENSVELGALIYDRINLELGADAPVIVSGDLAMLSKANLVLASSNAAEPIIMPEMLGRHDTIICDVAVPEDVSTEVIANCKHVEVIRGGLVRLPKNPQMRLRGNDLLGEGVIYACIAETLLMGLEGINQHGSYGRISKHQVFDMLALADKHGFTLARVKVENIF